MGYTPGMDDPKKWTRLSRHTFLETPWYNVSHDRYVRPDGTVGDYHYLDIPGSVMILPVCDDGRLVMVRQFRYLMGRASLEFPAGGMVDGDAEANARRELREEAGLEAAYWRKLGEFAPYNGVSNEVCRVFVATDLSQVGPEPEASEEIEVVRIPAHRFDALVQNGEMWDGMSMAAFRYLEQWMEQGGTIPLEP